MLKTLGFSCRRGGRWAGWTLTALCLALRPVGDTAAFAAGVDLVSRVAPGLASDTGSLSGQGFAFPPPSVSADGRYVAFASPATNLVPGQSGVHPDNGIPPRNVFLQDRVTGAITLVSHAASSPTATANDFSEGAVLSADGRWLAFLSQATDLVTGPQGTSYGQYRLLLYDRLNGTTTLVSSSSSIDGANGYGVHDLALSADGRYVAFSSDAPDLVPGVRDTNRQPDVFLYDRVEGKTTLVSHVSASATTSGSFYSLRVSISADGRFVTFFSLSTDLAPGQGSARIFFYDRVSGKVTPVGPGDDSAISGNGLWIVFGAAGSYSLYARPTGVVSLVTHAPGQPTVPAGGPPTSVSSRPAISSDGRFIAFLSASNLVPGQGGQTGFLSSAFLYDRTSGEVTLASRAGSAAATPGGNVVESPSLSDDGRLVAFVTASKTQVPGQIDTNGAKNVFLFDRTAGGTMLVSSSSGNPAATGDADSSAIALSANGAALAFYSTASDLVPGLRDLNDGQDAFVYDTAARSTSCATRHASGYASATADAESSVGPLSGDGRYAVFESRAVDLVPGQIPASPASNVFLYDRATHATVLVSHASGSPVTGGAGDSGQAALSADGRYVAFLSTATDLVAGVSRPVDPGTGRPPVQQDVFLYDRVTGVVTLVSRSALNPAFTGNGESRNATVSADGRWIAYTSAARDLVPGFTYVNNVTITQVFLYDRVTGATILVSRSAANPTSTGLGESYGPALSADGRYLVFHSEAPDLVPGQTNATNEARLFAAFLFDRVTGAMAVVSHGRSSPTAAFAGLGGDPPVISGDGRYVAFVSRWPDLADQPPSDPDTITLYLYDRVSGAVRYVSRCSDSLYMQPSISADGRWIAFLSDVDQLVPGFHNSQGHSQVYLLDQLTGALTLLTPSASTPGRASLVDALYPRVSQDGRYVAYSGGDVIPGQGGESAGVYLYDRIAGTTLLASRTLASETTSGGGILPALSADGRSVAFSSGAPDLVANDLNARPDVFLFSLDLSAPGGGGGPVTVPPCALFDGSLRSNLQKVLAVAGACGVPAGAHRVTVKITARRGTSQGNLRFYPGNVVTIPSGTLRFQAGQTASASFDLPLVAANGAGDLTVLPFVRGNGTARVTVEVDGYTP